MKRFLLFLVCMLLPVWVLAQTQQRNLHAVPGSGDDAAANGNVIDVSQMAVVGIHNTRDSSWDGTLTYEGSIDGTNWVSVSCRQVSNNLYVTSTTAAANFVECAVSWANKFRARISGRSTGSTIVTAQLAKTARAGEPAIPTAYFFSCNDTATTPEYMRSIPGDASGACPSTQVAGSNGGGYLLARNQVLTTIRCAPGGADTGQTWTFTVALDESNTVLICSLPNPATECVGTGSVNATAGQRLTIEHTDTSAFDGGGVRCVVEGLG